MSERWRGCLFEIAETLVLTLIIFFVIQTFCVQPYQILQISMEHTLEPGQYVLVDKLTPRFDDYKRGDVIVFNPPQGFSEEPAGVPFIKRIVGVAGDKIEIRNNAIYVNDVKLNEPYVYDGQPTTATGGQTQWFVQPGQLFVLGDHREESEDSRRFGPIDKSTVIGRAWLRYWPLPNLGFVSPASHPELNATAAP